MSNHSLFRSKRAPQATPTPAPPKSPKDTQKRLLIVGGGLAVVVFAIMALTNSNNTPPAPAKNTPAPAKNASPVQSGTVSVTPGQQANITTEAQFGQTITQQAAQIKALQDKLTSMQAQIESKQTPATSTSTVPPPPSMNGTTPAIPAPPTAIVRPGQTTVETPPPTLPPPISPTTTTNPSPLPPLPSTPSKPSPSKGPKTFSVPADSSAQATDAPASSPTLLNGLQSAAKALPTAVAKYKFSSNANAGYLPAGAFANITLLNGLDAGTSQTAQAQPQPVIANIVDNAILPGNASYKLRNCFLVGSGYGEIASERVQIRFFKLSCVDKKDRLVVAQDIEANLVDSDGKLGMRGVITEKQGAKMGKALLAGFASGLANALGSAQSSVLSNVVTGTTTSSISGSAALRASGLSGAQKAADMLADMYLKEAQALYPIITMDAGRRGTVMFTKGTPIQWMDVDSPVQTDVQLKSATR